MQENLEPEESFPLGKLPIEAKASVTQAIITYDNIDDIINTIEATKLINREFNNVVKNVYGDYNKIEIFTTLIHLVSDKFPEATTEATAKKFEISTAQKYVALGKNLLIISGTRLDNTLDDAKQAIAKGADVNFTASFIVTADQIHTPLFFAAQMQNPELITLLLLAGIKTKTINMMVETSEKIQKARAEKSIQ